LRTRQSRLLIWSSNTTPRTRLFGGRATSNGAALHLACDRAEQRQSGRGVVRSGGQHQRRPAPGLLVTGLRAELQPDKVAAIRDEGTGHHQASFPRG
jgi:hypothetical protein